MAGWAIGAANCYVEHPHGRSRLVIGVRCRFGSLTVDDIALLDTGAQWSVVSHELAELVGVDASAAGESVSLHSRYGTVSGGLHRLPIWLLADHGEAIEVDATVLVVRDWAGPPVIGFRGCLERIRIALDPGCRAGQEWFYFGDPSTTDGPCLELMG